ncbi:MAG: RNA-protein complex protein Nop10 [Theionarchaea archaeon]|nr:RNA-protein complex protein Nop10 [Theionarchaea archaeon]
MKKLKRCKACRKYTLGSSCPHCGERASSPHPPRYSPQDKFGKYRRMLKRDGRL